jgi:hypothetical protein
MCTCIQKIDAKLAEHNGMLETNWLSDPSRAMICVVKKSASGTPKKPPRLEATYCPFCGERYPNTRDIASLGASK